MSHTLTQLRRSLLTLLALPVLALWIAAPVAAQANNGAIVVTVEDADGARLPGVTVEAVDEATGFDRLGVTDAEGIARFPALPPGTYTVTAGLEGFQTVRLTGIPVRVGETVPLTVTLELSAVEDEVTVTAAAPVVDVYRTDTSTNITPEQIEELPVQDRNPEKLAFLAPGVQRERGSFRFIQGGPVIGAGGNASQSSIFVDGVDFTDQALGLSRARFSQDAVREFRVITNRFDAEMGGTAGGGLSIVTRSGTNEFAGSAFGFYRDDALRSEGALEEDGLPFEREQFGFTLGGPIRRDRTHFFTSVERIDEQGVVLFRPGGAFADLARDVAHPVEQTLGLASLTHQFADGSTGIAKLVGDRYREENFRVGGVSDVSNGQALDRDNYNLTLGHTKIFGESLNELRLQGGIRDYDEPPNTIATEEWFSGGNTLRTGTNLLGYLIGEGDYWELRDTYHWARGDHGVKVGGSWFHVEERSVIDTFQEGLFIYLTDDRSLPLAYAFGEGSSDVSVETDIYSLFVQDDWRVADNLTVNLGLRYDYDDNGNNPDFQHPLVGDRSVDDDNIQPRAAFVWDVTRDGKNVVRGGAGLFTGRYLLVPVFTELQQNGVTGRILRQRLNGLVLGLPPAFWLDPDNPTNTGILLAPDISLLADSLEAPESTQVSLGYTRALGATGLYAGIEGVYSEGDNEIVIRDTNFGGNDNPVRLDPRFNQINTYTNDGESEYQAMILSLNGSLDGGHIVTASVTFAEKENIADDFSPAFPSGYPSDPADIQAEWGNARGVEDVRAVVSGVFRLPWQVTVAPIYEYGSGQYWTRLLGYDFNGDGKNSDRAPGVRRNDEDGPDFNSFSLRVTKSFVFGDTGVDLILEGFNLFDETNFDVTSVDQAEFLAGPTLANPAAPFVANPNFGRYRATLDPREFQLGLRVKF